MAVRTDILLAPSAKYFGFVDDHTAYNTNWDITWSFTYALTGEQHGFCTYLAVSSTPSLSGLPLSTIVLPGQYLTYHGNYPYLLDEDFNPILDENDENIYVEGDSVYSPNGFLAIAFDSTGYFALSDEYLPTDGVSLENTIPNSLIVREGPTVIFNEALSSLDSSFQLATSAKEFKTLRFRVANAVKKLYVDYKNEYSDSYRNLATINLSNIDVDGYRLAYPTFAYCSPVSSLTIDPSKLWLKNFHVHGNPNLPTTESVEFTPLSSSSTGYTTISGITAVRAY